jgi:hypothetical protein
MMRFSALKTQKDIRDMIQLPKLADDVVWVDESDIVNTPYPLILSGLWLFETPDSKKILQSRSRSGLSSIIVPKYKAGDIGNLIDAPTSVHVVAADFNSVTWKNKSVYDVPGVSYFKTSLHAGRLAIANNLGPVILYSKHSAAYAPVILCSAAVTGSAIGVNRSEQKKLLQEIFSEIQTLESFLVKKNNRVPAASAENNPNSSAVDLNQFLDLSGGKGAALLLLFATSEIVRHSDAALIEKKAKALLGIHLSEDEIKDSLKKLPEVSKQEILDVLVDFGWGAFLRRLEIQETFQEE